MWVQYQTTSGPPERQGSHWSPFGAVPPFTASNTWKLVQKAFFAQEREGRLATLEGTDRCHAEGLA